MSRIKETFGRLHAKGEKALVGFITAGDPDAGRSLEIARQMCCSGLDLLELGVPFSDPTADGPVIQRSSARAISAGMNMKSVINMVRLIREFSSIPIVLFSYYNPILAYGAVEFYKDATAAGADGTLVVDLPPEESAELTGVWGDGLDFIRLIAPTTPPERMARNCLKSFWIHLPCFHDRHYRQRRTQLWRNSHSSAKFKKKLQWSADLHRVRDLHAR